MRILGWLAMALGVIGIVVSLGLAAGVWVVKPDIEARAHELVTAADAGMERALALTETVAGKLTDVSDRVGEVKSKADELVAAPVIAPAVATALATTITDLMSGPYAALRTEYAALRERAATVGEALRALDNAIPAVALPGVAMERLQDIDAKLVQIDASVTSLAHAGAAGLAEPGLAATVSDKAAAAQEILATVGEAVADVDAKLQDTRGRLAEVDDRIALLLTAGAGIGMVAGLYLAGLNILLVQQGRRWSRRSATPPA